MQIQKLIDLQAGEVSNSPEDIKKYSHDASIFEIVPEAIVFPKNSEDVKKLVSFVTREKSANPTLSLTARSAGTDMSGGSVNDSVIVDFTRHFNKIIELGQDYAITEPGVFYRDFEKQTLQHGLIMPAYTASKSLCALGGMLANNSGGEKSLSYGKMENYVQELSVVLSDGNEYVFRELTELELEGKMKLQNFEGTIYRKMYDLVSRNFQLIEQAKPNVTKNSAGYYLWNIWNKKTFNLIKLFVGSQGTLGIFTRAKLKLIKPHSHSELLVMFLNDLHSLGDVVNTVMQFKPESFESFDDHTFSLAIKFLPGLIKKMKGNLFKLAWQFVPEMWMTLTGGLPKLVLIAEFTGDTEEEALVNLRAAQNEVEKEFNLKTHITRNAQEAEKYWTVRRESFNLLRQHVKNKHTAPFIDDIVVHPKDLPEFLPQLDAIFKKYPSLVYTIAGHAGDANFHIIPLMDFTNSAEREIIPPLSEEVYALVAKYKGSITGEHNDGLVRGPYLDKMYSPEIMALFRQVKNIFDPQNIFNPHKKTDATKQYLVDHIEKE